MGFLRVSSVPIGGFEEKRDPGITISAFLLFKIITLKNRKQGFLQKHSSRTRVSAVLVLLKQYFQGAQHRKSAIFGEIAKGEKCRNLLKKGNKLVGNSVN